MRGAHSAAVALLATFALAVPAVSAGADEWLEIKSPDFVVLSNAGEHRAREVAWRLEQIRAALLAGWPWVRARLDRPVQVLVAKDEATMRALVPQFWEDRGAVRPDSVFVMAPDRHYIALRADTTSDEQANVTSAFTSYWSYGAVSPNAAFVQTVAQLLSGGAPSGSLPAQTDGRMETLENGYIQYLKKPLFPHSRLKAQVRSVAKDFTTRVVPEPEAAVSRAGLLVAMGRTGEARALLAEVFKAPTPPLEGFEVEALLLDREGKQDEARTALLKAEAMGSANFFVPFRLATLTLPATADRPTLTAAEQRLRRAADLNWVHAPTLSLLANVLARLGQGDEAVTFAERATALEPADAPTRLSLARALWAARRRDEASGHARIALTLAKSEQERNQVQEFLGFFARMTTR